MDPLDTVRRARAGLAWLCEPATPYLQDLLGATDPVTALRRLAGADLPTTHLRAEVREIPRHLRWSAMTEALTHAGRDGMRVVIPQDDEWPTRLADLAAAPDGDGDPMPQPVCLWVRGDKPLADTLHRSVTLAGSRACTAYGAHVASDLGHDLSGAGWSVVTSGTFGVEAAAIRGALAAEGIPVAVLPGGLDRPHPAGNSALFDQVVRAGLLVSPWPPGAPATKARSAGTARLLAALTCGTVVVEAALASRTLQVLPLAIGLGRPVMLVPGPVTSALSAGVHAAVRRYPQGRLVTGAADVLADLAATERPGTAGAGSGSEQ